MAGRMKSLNDGMLYVANVSGGRSSAYMLRVLLDQFDGTLPDNVLAAFMNTGKERTESLDFVHALGREWNVHITWLEYRYDANATGGIKSPKNTFAVVDYETASRNGEPFEALIQSRGYLPNVAQRICTYELKVNTLRRYMRTVHGAARKAFVNLIGIRKDEGKRAARIFEHDCNVQLPLYRAGVTLDNVNAFWARSSFDLAFPQDGSLFTNCDMCFLKGRHKLVRILRNEPDRADWWENMERITGAQFSKRNSYKELRTLGNELTLFEDEAYSCFCG